MNRTVGFRRSSSFGALVVMIWMTPSTLPAQEQMSAPSMELLEYLAAWEETDDGRFIDPLDYEFDDFPETEIEPAAEYKRSEDQVNR